MCLVLGVVRLALDCDYDRLEYMVHHDTLLRRIMGLESHFSGEFGKGFHHKTLSENVCHVDEALLAEINAIVVQAGRSVFKKKDDEPIHAKSDTYVLETNVHFPTDLNLLWDACRKCLDLLPQLARSHQPAWLAQSGHLADAAQDVAPSLWIDSPWWRRQEARTAEAGGDGLSAESLLRLR